MNAKRSILVLALGIGVCASVNAQVPAGAPTGSTGQCNDGTYATAATKSGACRGHKGVKTWFAGSSSASKASANSAQASQKPAVSAPAAAPATAKAPASTSNSAPSSAPKSSTASSATPAPGGGSGKVWVNTASNVYHCPGTKYYGTTKAGKYMTEADAKAAGAHPDHGKGCGL